MLSDIGIISALSNMGSLTEAGLLPARTLAESRLRQIAGDALYDAVHGDESHVARESFEFAESALAVMYYLPTKNIHSQSDGVLKSATLASGDTMQFLSPEELSGIQSEFLEMAETALRPFLPAQDATGPVKSVEDDE